jgi:hypothetical protein
MGMAVAAKARIFADLPWLWPNRLGFIRVEASPDRPLARQTK